MRRNAAILLAWYFLAAGNSVATQGPFEDIKQCEEYRQWVAKNWTRTVSTCWWKFN